jgi:hypothetical protein
MSLGGETHAAYHIAWPLELWMVIEFFPQQLYTCAVFRFRSFVQGAQVSLQVVKPF